MADLLNSVQAELQTIRVEITALLRDSLLAEEMKKSLMMILPYLPVERLKPLQEKLQQEQALRSQKRGISQEKFQQMKVAVAKIKRAAWKEAENENTPSPNVLDQDFSEQLSAI